MGVGKAVSNESRRGDGCGESERQGGLTTFSKARPEDQGWPVRNLVYFLVCTNTK
jgi:hypothetical protein